MKNRSLLSLGALLFLCPILTNCAAAVNKMRIEDIGDTVDLFNQHLRWKRCNMALKMVNQELQPFFIENCDDLTKDLGLQESNITSLILNEDKTEATIRIRFEYYQLPRNILIKKSALTTWHKNGTSWQLVEAEGAFYDDLFKDELKDKASSDSDN